MNKRFKSRLKRVVAQQAKRPKETPLTEAESAPDWTHKCENCGATPILPITGMCGPCTFGEADAAGGNW